jgi:hypothetical protein
MTKPAIDIVTAMNSPALFANWFPGETWDGWRAALKAVLRAAHDRGRNRVLSHHCGA